MWDAGNTAGAARATNPAFKYGLDVTQDHSPEMRALRKSLKTEEILVYRHPDPKTIDKINVIDPSIQTRGAWKKINLVDSAKTPGTRLGFASITYEGKQTKGPYAYINLDPSRRQILCFWRRTFKLKSNL